MNLCTHDGCGIVSLSANTSAALTFWLQDGSFFEEPIGISFNAGSKFPIHDGVPRTYRAVTGQVLQFDVEHLTSYTADLAGVWRHIMDAGHWLISQLTPGSKSVELFL